MRAKTRHFTTTLAVVFLVAASQAYGQAFDAAEQRARERAAAEPISLIAPSFPVSGYELKAVVLNMTSRPVDFTLHAHIRDEEPQELAQGSIDHQRHLEIPLALTPGTDFLELSYTDIPTALDVRLVASGALGELSGQVVSYPFQIVGNPGAGHSRLFAWPALEAAPARFQLVNPSGSEVTYRLTTTNGEALFTLAPYGSALHEDSGGYLTFDHEAAPGTLLAWGFQDIDGRMIEVTSHDLVDPDFSQITEPTTVHVPTFNGILDRLFVTLANSTSEPRLVPLQVVDLASTEPLAVDTFEVAPHSTKTLDLTAQWSFLESHWSRTRIALGPIPAGIFPSGFTTSGSGQIVELSFQEIDSAHASGMYPVPSLEHADAVLHLLNTSSSDATIGAELSWQPRSNASHEISSYSMGPFDVIAGQGFELNLRNELNKQIPDMLDRLPPQHFEQGFLKWIAIQGDKKFLGRTEIVDLESQDRFGINCDDCCWETPRGVIVNEAVTLTKPNTSKKFETGIKFDTCSGSSGPFYERARTLNYSAPYSWDGRRLSASDGADEEITWTGTTMGVEEDCQRFTVELLGIGRGKACGLILCKDSECSSKWSGTRACDQQADQDCTKCRDCCDQQMLYKICNGKRQDIAQNEHRTCLTHCETDICG